MTDHYVAPPIANVPQAARELGLSKPTIYRLVRDGVLPRLRHGQTGLKIPMPAARRHLAGETVDPDLFEPQDK